MHNSEQPQSDPLVGHTELAPKEETIPVEELKKKSVDVKAFIEAKYADLQCYLEAALADIVQLGGEDAQHGASHFEVALGAIKRTIAQNK